MAALRRACCILRDYFRAHVQDSGMSKSVLVLSRTSSSYTDYEVSTEEFKYVERLLPSPLIPSPPHHDSYPTPSGWVPPSEKSQNMPYFVKRTRHHNFPVYFEIRDQTRRLTQIKGILGDIWAFEADLAAYLEKKYDKKMYTQVHEVARYVRVKGHHVEYVSNFLLEKGF